MSQKRSLSGIKPTGTPHLGNYLGMIRPAIDLQEDHEAFYFVADYHALTTMRDADQVRDLVYDVTAYFLAFGLDPERAAFFRQSDIPEVTELTWMLSCVTHMGLLERAHAYKKAKQEGRANEINHGIFAYPVLMASDILIYDSDVVPVGSDQVQHVEMTRDMAQKFNRAFGGEYLKLPEIKVREGVGTIPGTDGQKMSSSYGNIIEPLEDPDELKSQIMSIKTASTGLDEPKDPDSCNVFQLYTFFADDSEIEQMRSRYREGGYGFGHAKQDLFEKMEAYFKPYREEYERLMSNPDELESALRAGEDKVRPVVEDVMQRVRHATGIGPSQ
jgi:tryptophanyl-tRNA synthetase